MYLCKLQLKSFRCFSELNAEFPSGINLIVGDNAQGKTNLLESIYYLANGKSYRTRKQEDLIRWGEEYTRLSEETAGKDDTEELVYLLQKGRKRQFLQNGVKQKGREEEKQILKAVLFCPEDLSMLRSGSALRRKFLDDAISSLRPRYKGAISAYKKLLDSKASILRNQEERPDLLRSLPDFNRQMVLYGAAIIHYRAQYMEALSREAARYHTQASSGENLTFRYTTVSTITDPLAPEDTLRQQLTEHQTSHYQAELASGQCLSGPHKDDFTAFIGEKEIKSFASQGQTRTAVISIKLAEREISRRDTGEEPILLLDDVLSELDIRRQNFILNEIQTGQVFITCCDKSAITATGKVYTIENHQLREE